MKRLFAPLSLEVRLPIVGGVLLLVIVLTVSGSGFLEVRARARQEAEERLRAAAGPVSERVRLFLQGVIASARQISREDALTALVRAPDSRRRAAAVRTLRDRLAPGRDSALAIEVLDRGGQLLLRVWPDGSIDSGAATTERADSIRVAPAGSYLADTSADSGGVGTLRLWNREVVYPVLAPITPDSLTRGYLVQWRRLGAVPDVGTVAARWAGDAAEVLLVDSERSVWTNVSQLIPVSLPDVAGPSPTGVETPGRIQVTVRIAGTSWLAVLDYPERLILQPARAYLRHQALVGVALMLFGVALIWLLGRSLSQPLLDLAGYAEQISAGQRVPVVEMDRGDEIGRLADAFNRLARQLDEGRHTVEARFQIMVDVIRDYAIFMLDQDGRVASWNTGAARLKGWQPDEIIGRHFSAFYPPEDIEAGKPRRLLETAIAEDRVEDIGWRVRKDGSRFFADVVINAVRDDRGALIGFVKVTRDVTERRRAEEALERTNAVLVERTHRLDGALQALQQAQESLLRQEKLATLGQLSSGVAHELRHPLSVMTNALYYLGHVLGTQPPKVQEYFDILRSQVELSDKIVSDLLDFARVRPPQREPVNVQELVEAQLRRLGRLERISVSVELPEDLPPAEADRVQVGQVLFNLVTNAVQAMGERGGALVVRGERENGQVMVRVSDTGSGIPEEQLERIFEPLFTTKSRGMGLGLAVSRALARANGGEITVVSRQYQGSTFTLTLPAAAAVPAA